VMKEGILLAFAVGRHEVAVVDSVVSICFRSLSIKEACFCRRRSPVWKGRVDISFGWQVSVQL
jgi:hypothetical protein